MLQDAQANVTNARFLKADVFQMGLAPETYDAITAYLVWQLQRARCDPGADS
jgi:hypothetical protein